MIKKITAIFLILSVNIFLLTNVVMLHHHHNGIPYFSLFETEQHNGSENYSCIPVADDYARNEATCQLDQNVDVIYKIEEDCHCFFCCLAHNHDKTLLQAVLFYFTIDFTLPDAEQSLRQPPYLISYHSIAATSGSGLRAPPEA
ncbi:MAG: hypothetical protein LBG15_14580 [Dysgonamonadaceae bacterium]|jgi:hypothetical protein|nr:hypothetical protein [Dysgonamonadaceae bacterium]